MSLTSCFRYILELPVATMNDLLRAAFSESDGAASQQWSGLPVDGYTADVSVRPTEIDTNPPTMDLQATNLEALLHLRMRVEVDIIEIPELDALVYAITFNLPGAFQKDAATPPVLWLRFPSVTAGALNLNVSGGQITLTPELVEPRIHAMYDATPTLGHTVLNNQPWVDLSTGPTTVQITIDIYDDDPGSTPFRGAISVQILGPTALNIKMPGHFKSQGISTTYMNTDMTVDVVVDVEQIDGKVTPKLSQVTSSDVTVTFVTPSLYNTPAALVMESEIANRFGAMNDDDFAQTFPTQAQVRSLIEDQIVTMAGSLQFPLFKPPMPGAGDEIDLTTFEPMTVAQQVLALQLEPLGDGTVCDTPDVFAHATGFSLAVAAVRVNQELEALETDNEGTVREMQGHDVTLSTLELSLDEGHINVSGMATAEVDCWDDPEVNFAGTVTLNPSVDPDGTIKITADAGEFTADDPCCADVNPQDIADVIEGDSRPIGNMPTDFSGVGQLALTVDSCDISTAGIVIHGGLSVVTMSQLSAGLTQRRAFWHLEPAGGG